MGASAPSAAAAAKAGSAEQASLREQEEEEAGLQPITISLPLWVTSLQDSWGRLLLLLFMVSFFFVAPVLLSQSTARIPPSQLSALQESRGSSSSSSSSGGGGGGGGGSAAAAPWLTPEATAFTYEPKMFSDGLPEMDFAVKFMAGALPMSWVMVFVHSAANRALVHSLFADLIACGKLQTWQAQEGAHVLTPLVRTWGPSDEAEEGKGARAGPGSGGGRPAARSLQQQQQQQQQLSSRALQQLPRRAWAFDWKFPAVAQLHKAFYDIIPTEKYLVFHTDGLLCGPNVSRIYDYWQYDLVGAPWKPWRPGEGTPAEGPSVYGNGGFSLRSKSMMLHIIENVVPQYDDVEAWLDSKKELGLSMEDSILGAEVLHYGGKLPTREAAMAFAVETQFHEAPLGYHKAWEFLQGRDADLERLLSNCPSMRTSMALWKARRKKTEAEAAAAAAQAAGAAAPAAAAAAAAAAPAAAETTPAAAAAPAAA
jgi:hypothetical protein